MQRGGRVEHVEGVRAVSGVMGRGESQSMPCPVKQGAVSLPGPAPREPRHEAKFIPRGAEGSERVFGSFWGGAKRNSPTRVGEIGGGGPVSERE